MAIECGEKGRKRKWGKRQEEGRKRQEGLRGEGGRERGVLSPAARN